MQIGQAARILRRMYDAAAPYGEQTSAIHFFAIKYANQIRDLSKKEILVSAGMRESYQTEIYKGLRLAQYVKVHKSPPWDV